jgi:xanthine dehydrogenase YagS FAD-binding subunit
MPSYDVMPNMELYQPVRVEDALDIASRYADRGWLVGGGQDTYGWLKDRAKRADALIDLSAIESLRGVQETADGIEIGALTTLTEIAETVCSNRATLCFRKPRLSSQAHRSAISAHSAATSRKMYAAGTTVAGLSCYRAGRQSLLRRHATGHEPRAFAV